MKLSYGTGSVLSGGDSAFADLAIRAYRSFPPLGPQGLHQRTSSTLRYRYHTLHGGRISDAGIAIRKHANDALEETRSVAVSTTTKVGEIFTDARTQERPLETQSTVRAEAVGETARRVYESGKEMVKRIRSDLPPK